jgi:hypothetical protein
MGGVEGRRVSEELKPYGYFGVCAVGGMLSAGTTHLAITPLDVLKVNMQVSLSPSLFFLPVYVDFTMGRMCVLFLFSLDRFMIIDSCLLLLEYMRS